MPTKSPMSRKIVSVAAYISFAVVFAFLIIDGGEPHLPAGAQAPLDEKIITLDGTTSTLRRLLKKPMVINFWATWCTVCIKELPVMSKMAKRFSNQVIFVGATVNSDISEVDTLKKRHFITYPHFAFNEMLVNLWQAKALPTTYIIDTTGKIVWSKSGGFTEDELEKGLAVLGTKVFTSQQKTTKPPVEGL